MRYCSILVGLMAMSFTANTLAFATPMDFFKVIKKNKLAGSKIVKLAEISPEKAHERNIQFLDEVKKRNYTEKLPKLYEFDFTTSTTDHWRCLAAIITESEKLSVSKLPKEYQDRSGYVWVGPCDTRDQGRIDYNQGFYQVFPLDNTLPLGAMTLADTYPLYDRFLKEQPQILCTDNDMNSEGIPRGQTIVHQIDDNITFYTGISRSSPAREVDGEIVWSDDRAIFVEDVDQGSLPEVQATLDFVSLNRKGILFFNFKEKDCFKGVEDGLNVLVCSNVINKDRRVTFQPNKNYSDVPLTLISVGAALQSHKVKRLILGVNGNNQIIEDTDYKITYTLKFSSSKGDRYLKVNVTFANTEMESQPECRTRLK